MNDVGNAVLTASLTVLAGVIVYIAGQLIEKFLIDPFREYRKVVGEIAVSLVLYANVGYDMVDVYIKGFNGHREAQEPGWEIREERLKQIIDNEFRRVDEAVITLRTQASQLVSVANAIPFYSLWRLLGVLPTMKDVNKASRALIGFSNSITGPGVGYGYEATKEVSKALRITTLSEKGGH